DRRPRRLVAVLPRLGRRPRRGPRPRRSLPGGCVRTRGRRPAPAGVTARARLRAVPDTRPFDLKLRGYERKQVDSFFAQFEGWVKAGTPPPDTPQFTLVLRGYDPAQVDRYLDELRRQADARAAQSRRFVGQGPGGLPGLLREVADSLEADGPHDVRD